MSEQRVYEQSERHKKKYSWLFWSTRDILLLAAIALVFGLILGIGLYPYLALLALGPIVTWGLIGLYLLPSFFIAYVLRRPGAAFLIALLYNLVMLPFSPFGFILMIGAVMHGFNVEAGIAIATRYRTFGLGWMALAGAISGVLEVFIYNIFYPEALRLAQPIVIGIVVVTTLSCTLVAIIAKLVADAVARTGALTGTALKREDVQEV
jgi:ABC-type thiamin/hydroxymethylpyrimidine transport system permease subunit